MDAPKNLFIKLLLALGVRHPQRGVVAVTLFILGCKSGLTPDVTTAVALPVEKIGLPGSEGGSASNSSVTTVSDAPIELKGFAFPREPELLREHGIIDDDEYEVSVNELSSWITRSGTEQERVAIIKKCTELYGNSEDSIIPSGHNLPCLVWRLEHKYALMLQERRSSRSHRSLVTIKKLDQWKSLAGQNFYNSFLRLDPSTDADLAKLAGFARTTLHNCEYKHATAAIIARAETFLPDKNANAIMDEFYPAATECLTPEDDGFERTHLRMGLLQITRGDTEKAKKALELAALAKDPVEDFRTYFWLGALAADDENSKGENKSWQTLIKKYPLTFHSVLAAHTMGVDPMERLVDGKDVNIMRRNGKQWNDFNTVAFIFELLIARQDATGLYHWSQFVGRSFTEDVHPENLLYLAFCHNIAENYRASFALLTRYMQSSHRETVSLELLNLIFPRPYSDEILAHSSAVDPLLIFALIRQESAFDPFARSGANARGLMQVLPSTARRIKHVTSKHLYEPATNIEIGTSYFQELLKKYSGTVEDALASYNAGARNVERWKLRYPDDNTLLFADLIPFKETRTYVAIILRNAYWYGRLMVANNDKLAHNVIQHSTQSVWKSAAVTQLLNVAWSKNSKLAVAALTNLFMPESDADEPEATKSEDSQIHLSAHPLKTLSAPPTEGTDDDDEESDASETTP